MSCCSRHKAVTTLKLFPHNVEVTQQLLPPACEKQYHYCERLPAKVEDDPRMLDMTFSTDDAWFNLMDYFRSQKTRMWSKEIPTLLMTLPFTLPVVECGVQCIAVRSLWPFSPKTSLTWRDTLYSPYIPRTHFWRADCWSVVPTRQRNISYSIGDYARDKLTSHSQERKAVDKPIHRLIEFYYS
jgi:hypothetical protein